MNPYTGEVLALVSTPSYDTNRFILGLTTQEWDQLNNDEAQPLYNRFRQTFAPGSTFKAFTAAIGLAEGTLDPEKDYGYNGTSWQKDSSWGDYYVTTLQDYQTGNPSKRVDLLRQYLLCKGSPRTWSRQVYRRSGSFWFQSSRTV